MKTFDESLGDAVAVVLDEQARHIQMLQEVIRNLGMIVRHDAYESIIAAHDLAVETLTLTETP